MKFNFLVSIVLSFAVFFAFEIKAQEWSPPFDISEVTAETDAPCVGVDAEGNGFAVWVQGDNIQNLVTGSRYDATTEVWSEPVTLSLHNSYTPQLTVSAAGDAIAVWRRVETDYQKVEYAVYHNGAWSFGAAVDSTHSDDENELSPQVAVDNYGHAIAVWQVGGVPGTVIRAGKYDFDSNTWSSIQDISANSPVNVRNNPYIAVNKSGDGIVVWELKDITNSSFGIEANKYKLGAWLGAEVVSSSETLQQLFPQVAIDNVGNGIAVWTEWDSVVFDYTVKSSRRTNFWDAPISISSTGNFSGMYTFIANIGVDNSGDAIAIWGLVDEPNSVSVIQGRVFQNSEWSTLTTNLSSGCEFSLYPSTAVNSSGDAYSTWTTQLSSTSYIVCASRYHKADNAWNIAAVISDPAEASARSDISTNNQGDFFTVWLRIEGDPSTCVIQATHLSNPVVVQPPDSITGQQIVHYFVIDTDRVNKISWTASSSSNIVAYEVYRDGALIALVPSSVFTYWDHHRIEDQSYSYQVFAINSSGTRSAPVTITIP